MSARVFGWWGVAVEAVRSLTCPPADVAASDRAFAHQVRQSALFRGASAVIDALARAWTDSRTRAAVLAMSADLPPRGRRLPFGLGIAAVSGVTAWLLVTFRSVLP
jgi:hypothetical protein